MYYIYGKLKFLFQVNQTSDTALNAGASNVLETGTFLFSPYILYILNCITIH